MAHAELALSRSGSSEPESFNQQQYGPFKVWTEACMYHAIVKRIARQNFLRVNQKDCTPILKGCSPGIHHRLPDITYSAASGTIVMRLNGGSNG
jgi:hypothetical protein